MSISCKTGYSEGFIVLDFRSVSFYLRQGISVLVFFNFNCDAADNRKGTSIERLESSFDSFHISPDGFLQFPTGHVAVERHQAIRHNHVAHHLFSVIRLKYRACETVARCNEHIAAVYLTKRVRHNRVGFVAAIAMENVGVCFIGSQDNIRRIILGLAKRGIKGFISLLRVVFARDHL